MSTDLVVYIPSVTDGQPGSVPCYVEKEKCTCPTDAELTRLLSNLHIETGHHADRDLELAQNVADWFGGKLVDMREPNNAEHGVAK
jgi:hypothetical protein